MSENVNTNLIVLVGGEKAAETTQATFLALASEGEWQVFDQDGAAVNTNASDGFPNWIGVKKARIVVKRADEAQGMLYTEFFDPKKLIKPAKWVDGVAAANQESTFTVVLPTIAAGEVVNVGFSTRFNGYGSLSPENYIHHYGTYSAVNGNSAVLAAVRMVGDYNGSFNRAPERLVIASALSAATADGTFAGDNTWTNGSKVVATDTDNTATIFVGSYVRPAGVTTPAFRVEAITASTITLSSVYYGTTITTQTATAEYIDAATADAAAATVKLVGQDQVWLLAKHLFRVTSFRTEILRMPSAVLTEPSVAYTMGTSVGKKVAEQEWFSAGNTVEADRISEPHLFNAPLYANSATLYDAFVVSHYHHEPGQFITTESPRTVVLYATKQSASGTSETESLTGAQGTQGIQGLQGEGA
jgi:hypothetical protein